MELDLRKFLWMCLVFLTVAVPNGSTVTHNLRYISTAITEGTSFPEYTMMGLLDGEVFIYYDSNLRKVIPKTEWIKKKDKDFWESESETFKYEQKWSINNMFKTMKRQNDTKGVHTWQWEYGCENNTEGSTTKYSNFAYDGEDYISLDLNTGAFTSHIKARLLQWNKYVADDCKHYLESECFWDLNSYLENRRSTPQRKAPPEVDLFQKNASSPVVCHATDFFPKEVTIYWQKNGENLNQGVDVGETLVNHDGTFQRRSVLTVSAEELDRNQYTCIIRHIGLEQELQLQASDRRVLSGGRSHVTVGVVVGVTLFVVAVWVWRKIRNRCATPDLSSPHRSCG